MKLIYDWRRVIRRAWSLRLMVLAGLLSGCEVVLPLFVDSMPRNVFAGLSLLAAIGGALARVVDQPKMYQDPPGVERRAKPRQKHDPERDRYD